MWVLPSLGRPQQAHRVAEAAADVQILLRLHRGDESLDEYNSLDWPDAWTVLEGERLGLADSLNWALKEYPNEKTYGFIADDTIPSPARWDGILEEAAGDWCISYPDDGVHGKNLCTHMCVGGNLLRELGWWALPGLKHSYLDTSLFAIGSELGILRYCPEVKFDHLHPVAKKAKFDKTYAIGQRSFGWDKARYERFLQSGEGYALIQDLKKAIPQYLK